MDGNFRNCAELAVACSQWIDIGSCYQASHFAVRAYRMARDQNPRRFREWEQDNSRSPIVRRTVPDIHMCVQQ